MYPYIEDTREPEEREPVVECDNCGAPLFDGDTVYKIEKKYICKNCIVFAERTLEKEDL